MRFSVLAVGLGLVLHLHAVAGNLVSQFEQTTLYQASRHGTAPSFGPFQHHYTKRVQPLSARKMRVRSFCLVDTETNQIIPGYRRLKSGAKIELSKLPTRQVTIRARTTTHRVASVRFRYNRTPKKLVSNSAPHLLAPAGPVLDGWGLEPGRHTLRAVPFARKNAKGRRGRRNVLKFKVVDTGNPLNPTPSLTPVPSPTPLPTGMPPDYSGALTAVWANEGGDKVAQEETRAKQTSVLNSIWDGSAINIFGARNEVVSFNIILEAAEQGVQSVQVQFNELTGPLGTKIGSTSASGDQLFNYNGRNIELFYVRYLQIRGLSRLGYETYDEHHVPERLRRSINGLIGNGGWFDRPDHDKHYPDIAVPLELVGQFSVAQGQNQSIWVDIYIPRNAPNGLYQGTVTIAENGQLSFSIPVELTVRDFTLPDEPYAKTMLYLGYGDINKRYLGYSWPNNSSENNKVIEIRNRHFQMAHRHRISLIDEDPNSAGASADRPSSEWIPRLDGSLFSAANGYDGPGAATGNNIFSIGTYGHWNWGGAASMHSHADAWVSWFDQNASAAEYFLYLIDESADYDLINNWANTLNNNSGPGSRLMSFATIGLTAGAERTPSLDIACSTGGLGNTNRWQQAADSYIDQPGKQLCFYNGRRPMSGTFVIDDDGVALRQIGWTQFKKRIHRWFYWESTYYNNFQGGTGETNVMRQAHTFGGVSSFDPVLGETGWNYTNGDGVLFYPGTDKVFPAESYGVNGPLASLRLKHWRRGIQDVDYLSMARQASPAAVDEIVNRIIPKVLWEYGVADENDPTWVFANISWSNDPDVWEEARKQLADIIESSGLF